LPVGVAVILLVSPARGEGHPAGHSGDHPAGLAAGRLAVAGHPARGRRRLAVILVRTLCGRVSTFWSGRSPSRATCGRGDLVRRPGDPLPDVLLHRLGMSLSEASSVVLIKGLVHTSVLAAVATIALLPLGSPRSRTSSATSSWWWSARCDHLGPGRLWLSRPVGLDSCPVRAPPVDEFRSAIRPSGRRRPLDRPLVALQFVYWLFMFALIPLILHSLGWRGDLAPIIVGQAVLQILMPFSPLPGGAGVAEFGYLELIGQSFRRTWWCPAWCSGALHLVHPHGAGAIGLGCVPVDASEGGGAGMLRRSSRMALLAGGFVLGCLPSARIVAGRVGVRIERVGTGNPGVPRTSGGPSAPARVLWSWRWTRARLPYPSSPVERRARMTICSAA